MLFTAQEEAAILERSGLIAPPATRYFSSKHVDMLREMYATPRRYYHTWQHALNVLAWANRACDAQGLMIDDTAAVKIAALFHDCVYDAEGSPSNEERSAAWLAGIEHPAIRKAQRMILATSQHGKLEAEDVDLPTAILLDCDMVTFAEPLWEVALQNDDNILAELRERYTEEQIRVGRTAFLNGLLQKRSVFLSPWFRERFEAQARANIARFIERL